MKYSALGDGRKRKWLSAVADNQPRVKSRPKQSLNPHGYSPARDHCPPTFFFFSSECIKCERPEL